MNMFKVRYSYGKVGNDNVGTRFPYLYSIADNYKENDQTKYYAGYNWATYGSNKSYNGLRYTKLASNDITWEIATKSDLGIDMALFNDKFTATIDYFDENVVVVFIWSVHSYQEWLVWMAINLMLMWVK